MILHGYISKKKCPETAWDDTQDSRYWQYRYQWNTSLGTVSSEPITRKTDDEYAIHSNLKEM